MSRARAILLSGLNRGDNVPGPRAFGLECEASLAIMCTSSGSGQLAYSLSTARILDLDQPEIDLARLLDLYPQLRAPTRSLVSSSRRSINPPNLHLFELRSSVAAAECVLHQLIPTRTLSVWMHRVEDDVMCCILSTVPRHKIRRVQFCLEYGTIKHGCVLGFDSGPTWFLVLSHNTLAGTYIFPYAETMASIVDLSFHALHWPDCPRDAVMPALRLRRLELVLDSFSAASSDIYMRQYVEETTALFYEGRAFVLRCPALEEVCISAPAKLPTLTVDVADIRDFLDVNLELGPAPPPRLVLRNVHLYDPGLGWGMQLLTASVSDICVQPGIRAENPRAAQG